MNGLNWQKIEVNSDYMQAIKFVSKSSKLWSEVEEIWKLLEKFNEVEYRYIPRESNKIADHMAEEVKRLEVNDVSLVEYDRSIFVLVV